MNCKFLAIGLILTVVCSSQNGEKFEQAADEGKSAVHIVADNQQSKVRLQRFLSGTWVSKNYVDALVSTQSPYKLSDSLFIVEMRYAIALKDTVIIEWRDHAPIKCEADFVGDNGNFRVSHWEWGGVYTINFRVFEKDSILEYFAASGQHGKLIKIPECQINGLSYVINKTLFDGKYNLLDSLANPTKKYVRFYSDGTINGLRPYNKYIIWWDYMGDEPQFDLLLLKSTEVESNYLSEWDWYGWKRSNDTTYVYNLTDDADHANYKTRMLELKFCMVKRM